MSKLEILHNIAGLADLVTALYESGSHSTLQRVLVAVDEELAPLQTIKPEGEDLGNDVLITITGASGTGKTTLYNIIGEALASKGFDLLGTDTDGTVELIRVVDPAGRFRNGSAEPTTKATDIPGDTGCDCPVCADIRELDISDMGKATLLASRRDAAKNFAELLAKVLGARKSKH